MKQSDAIKKISEWTKNWENCDLSEDDKFAKSLMNFLEKELGMLPPTITILPNSYNRPEGTYGFEVNEWEEEDESDT